MTTTIFECNHCGHQLSKWQGQCPECGKWGSFEAGSPTAQKKTPSAPPGQVVAFGSIKPTDGIRLATGIHELDRVLGGGLVRGSLVLLGGEPGIGKSTLVLQLIEKNQQPSLYVSGEESAEQIKTRIDRLGMTAGKTSFLGETTIDTIVATIIKEQPALAIIDSIQTMYDPNLPSGPGSANQVRTCTVKLLEVAKSKNVTILIVGHVTKGGEVAGPKTLEHLVDAVLYLEGDPQSGLRILRGVKNRFGSTDEVGIFEMRQTGLHEVANPSSLFLSQDHDRVAGSVIIPALEGSRVFLLELQALVSTTAFGYPQRKSYALDLNRVQLLIAVLTRRLGLKLGNQDVYLNVIGGIKATEPALDAAVAAAIISADSNKIIPRETVIFGEIGLGGEVRPVRATDKRLQEAVRLGFTRAIVPAQAKIKAPAKMELVQIKSVKELAERIK